MLSNKDYYKPVLEDEQMFVESKEKFDTATTSQSPQELKGSSDSGDAEKDESSDSQPGQEGGLSLVCIWLKPMLDALIGRIAQCCRRPVKADMSQLS